MDKQALIKALETMPDEATICLDGGYVNLLEAEDVIYDPDQNIIIIS